MRKTEILKFLDKKKVLVTGHTGFKGSWMISILHSFNCEIYGISHKQFENKYNYKFVKKYLKREYFFDLSNFNKTQKIINTIKPDVIFHFAAQALVFTSYKYPMQTFQNNLNSTLSILETLRFYKHKIISIFITSDKVYENKELNKSFVESDTLKGDDPYSCSKVAIEMALNSYFKTFKDNKKLSFAITRAGNVIGGGDWANDRIVPDAYKSWYNDNLLIIRSPNSTRPWQHVLEPLYGYILLAYKLSKSKKINGEAFNFGPSKKNNATVSLLINNLSKRWSDKKIFKEKLSNKYFEHKLLSLNSKKSKNILGWKSVLTINETCSLIHDWYNSNLNSSGNLLEMDNLIKNQIKFYENKFFK